MKWILLISLFAILGIHTAQGQVNQNVKIIFTEADKLYDLVDNISYTYQNYGAIQSNSKITDQIGEVYIQKVDTDTVGYYWHLAEKTQGATSIYNGKAFAYISHKYKYASKYESSLLAQRLGCTSNSYLISPIVKKHYFTNLLKDSTVQSIEILSDTVVLGDPCYQIKVQYLPENVFQSQREHYFIQKNNFFCKGITTYTMYAGKRGYNEFIITTAEVNVKLKEDLFTIYKNIPAKYKVRDAQKIIATIPPLLQEGEKAPKFKGYTIDGDKITNRDLRGKVTLVDFWYVACPPCIKSIPVLDSIARVYKYKNVQVLGMNPVDSEDDIRRIKDVGSLSYPTIMVDNHIPDKFEVRVYPVYYIIDEAGKIAHTQSGYNEDLYEQLSSAIDGILGVDGK